MVNHTQLDHEKENLSDVFGLSSDEAHQIRYIIAFESFKGYIMQEELYPDTKHEDIPRILTTKSGCLERCYNHIKSMAQKEMMLLTFFEQHEHWTKGYKMWSKLSEKIEDFKNKFNQDPDNADMDSTERQMKTLILDMIQKKIGSETKGIQIIVDCMKNSKYKLDKFIELYEERTSEPDIQDMIRKAEERERREEEDDNNPFKDLF